MNFLQFHFFDNGSVLVTYTDRRSDLNKCLLIIVRRELGQSVQISVLGRSGNMNYLEKKVISDLRISNWR